MNDQLACTNPDQNPNTKQFCDDNKDKTASDVCKEIQKKAQSKSFLDVADDIVKSIWPIRNPFGSNASSAQTLVNHLNSTMRTSEGVNQTNTCIQNTTQSQSNVINGLDIKCLKNAKKYMTSDQLFKYSSGGMKDIKQINTANSEAICRINLALQTLTNMDASIDNSALQSALNSAKGLMSNSDSSQDVCNDISVNMSACKYINQNQCCLQHTNQIQSNLINANCTAGAIESILQTNNGNSNNTCQLSAQASISDDFKDTIRNSISQSAKNESEGLTPAFLIILLVIFLLIVGGPVALTAFTGSKIIKYIGPIFLITGIVFFIIWGVTRKSEQTIANSPFSACQGAKGLQASLLRAKLGDVKDRVKQDDVIGYDFFIDVDENQKGSDIDGASLPDTQLGSVFYITELPPSSSTCDPINQDKMATISYKKATQKIQFLVIAIVSTVVGVGMILYSMFAPNPAKTNLAKTNLAKTNLAKTNLAKLKGMVNKVIKQPPKEPGVELQPLLPKEPVKVNSAPPQVSVKK